jgi:hypothetical protein
VGMVDHVVVIFSLFPFFPSWHAGEARIVLEFSALFFFVIDT